MGGDSVGGGGAFGRLLHHVTMFLMYVHFCVANYKYMDILLRHDLSETLQIFEQQCKRHQNNTESQRETPTLQVSID